MIFYQAGSDMKKSTLTNHSSSAPHINLTVIISLAAADILFSLIPCGGTIFTSYPVSDTVSAIAGIISELAVPTVLCLCIHYINVGLCVLPCRILLRILCGALFVFYSFSVLIKVYSLFYSVFLFV